MQFEYFFVRAEFVYFSIIVKEKDKKYRFTFKYLTPKHPFWNSVMLTINFITVSFQHSIQSLEGETANAMDW